MQDVFSRE